MLKDPKSSSARSCGAREWLIEAIEQRRRIIRVTECIDGEAARVPGARVAYLKPMILHDIAESVGMHGSRRSRAVTSNKYVHTPQGLFELSTSSTRRSAASRTRTSRRRA
ncbi:MAG: hypothetical protein R3F14_14980 [Polyangiaceae bacterium]